MNIYLIKNDETIKTYTNPTLDDVYEMSNYFEDEFPHLKKHLDKIANWGELDAFKEYFLSDIFNGISTFDLLDAIEEEWLDFFVREEYDDIDAEYDSIDDYVDNAPCDNSGFCSGSSCPYYYGCKM